MKRKTKAQDSKDRALQTANQLQQHSAVRMVPDNAWNSNGKSTQLTNFSHDFSPVPARNTDSCPGFRKYGPSGSIFNIFAPPLQAKLKIGLPNDKYEQEADRIAELIMNAPKKMVQRKGCLLCEDEEERDVVIQTKPISQQITPLIQLQEEYEEADLDFIDEEEDNDEEIMMKRIGKDQQTTNINISNEINESRGSGAKLPSDTLNFMESRFGTDFSSVRIHADSQSAKFNNQLSSSAFTIGKDIYFNRGSYKPREFESKKLLAHELTHVVQQRRRNNEKTFSLVQMSPGSPAGGCGVCYGSPRLVGIAAHIFIQKALQAFLGENAVIAEKLVPYPKDENGRLDIAIPTKLDTILIAEIKPNNKQGISDGNDALDNYDKQLQRLGMKAIKLYWLPPLPPIPFPTLGRSRKGRKCPRFHKLYLSSDPKAPGVILYHCEPDYKKLIKVCECIKTSKKKKTKRGAKASDYNFGLGISLFSSGGGSGNVGFGISIMSKGVSYGTVSGGIVYNSDGMAVGTVSGGISKYSAGATTLSADIGKSEKSIGAKAISAASGSGKSNVGATAVSAGSGKQEGKIEAQAGVKGTTTGKSKYGLEIKGMTDTEIDKVVQQAAEIEEMLKNASPAQRKLFQEIVKQQSGGKYKAPEAEGSYQVSDPGWIRKVLDATQGISESDTGNLAKNVDWTPRGISSSDLKKSVNNVIEGQKKGEKKGPGDSPKGSEGDQTIKLNLHPKAKRVADMLIDKEGIKITKEVEELNQIIPKDFNDDQMKKLEEKIAGLKKDEKATIESILKAVSILVKELKEGKQSTTKPKPTGSKKTKEIKKDEPSLDKPREKGAKAKEKEKATIYYEEYVRKMIDKIDKFDGWESMTAGGISIRAVENRSFDENKPTPGYIYMLYPVEDEKEKIIEVVKMAGYVVMKAVKIKSNSIDLRIESTTTLIGVNANKQLGEYTLTKGQTIKDAKY